MNLQKTTPRNVYIVVFSPGYGGAEKRFFDIFRGLLNRGFSVKYVAPSSLTEKLLKDFGSDPNLSESVISIDSGPNWNRMKFIKGLWGALKSVPHGSHFHYPLTCLWPLHLLRRDQLSLSFVDCTSTPSLLNKKKTSVWAWFSFFLVKRIDILSPAVLKSLNNHSRENRMTLTPGGTFLLPKTLPTHLRQPKVCFIGRLVPGKGLEDFFDVLPNLWMHLKGDVPNNFSFVIAGYGLLADYAQERVRYFLAQGVPIEYAGFVDAEDLLSKSMIFLSLQVSTNYPSRVVAESLSSGCSVIVRDTGDSRSFGNDIRGLSYCKPSLDAKELSSAIKKSIFDFSIQPHLSQSISESAATRFGSSGYLDYFMNIFDLDSSSN